MEIRGRKNLMYSIQLDDGRVIRRHIDHIRHREVPQSNEVLEDLVPSNEVVEDFDITVEPQGLQFY